MECPKCGSEMTSILSFINAEDYIEAELKCPKGGLKYYGVLYPVKVPGSIGGGNESDDN